MIRLRFLTVLLVTAALLFAACGSSNQTIPDTADLDTLVFDANQILSVAADTGSFAFAMSPTIERPSSVKERLKDAATSLLRANIAGISSATFDIGDREVAARMIQFASLDDAFGYYKSIRPAGLTGVKIGTEGYWLGDSLIFARGAYIARTWAIGDADSAAVDSTARIIDRAIGGVTGLPTTFILFPFSGKVQGEDEFYSYDFLAMPGVDRVYTTDYSLGADTVTLFLTQDSDGKKFAALLKGAEDVAEVGTAPALFNFEPGYAITFDHPSHGQIVAGRVRGKIVGLFSPGRDIGHQLLSRWVRGLH